MKLKVSMDGLRRNLSNATKDLMEELAEVIKENDIECDDLLKKMNEVRGMVGMMNCVYDPDNSDDMNEIGIELPWMEDLKHEQD